MENDEIVDLHLIHPPKEVRRISSTRTPRRVVSASDIIRGGCGYFLRHGTVEMVSLAGSLSISRATLYRVVHSRDRLLGDVLWQLGEQLLNDARAARSLPGPDGVLQITRLFIERVLNEKRFRDFLRAEPEVAARVLFTPSGGVHTRAVAAQRDILLEVRAATGSEATEGAWLSGDVDSIAYLYVSIVEAVMYAELFGDRRPDRQLAERAARALLVG